jgi:hypothetical protein
VLAGTTPRPDDAVEHEAAEAAEAAANDGAVDAIATAEASSEPPTRMSPATSYTPSRS